MFFYSIGIKIYVFFIYLVSPFNHKASKAVKGRKNFFQIHTPDHQTKYIWFHVSSLGEFEQGRPIIEKIKREHPEKKILLSFYSPSGFEIRKNYQLADKVIYLPFDSSSNAKRFFDHFQIEMAVFVKYDVWPFFIKEILRRKIPVFLTSAVFRDDHFYFKWYGKFFLNFLKEMNKIFVQDHHSVELGKRNGLSNIEHSGDVRVDRVVEIKSTIAKMPLVESFINNKKCIVFGSVYEYEINIIQAILRDTNEEVKLIIAPHEINEHVLDQFKNAFSESIFYADLNNYKNERVLIIDHVGSLNKIYQYASIAYVGGGYSRRGMHNILEPAVFNIPVCFGPHYHKFPEAISLLENDLVFVENSAPRLAKIMAIKLKENISPVFIINSQKWFNENSGATHLIYNGLSPLF